MATIDNPYAPPQSPADNGIWLPPRLTISRMLALLGVGLAGGATLGVLTSAVNGVISPQYFRDVMDWHGPDISPSAVGQGALEGAMYGIGYAIIFILLIALTSRRRCHFRTALNYGLVALSMAFAFWVLGGAAAVSFARLFPDRCDSQFFGHQLAWPALGYYAWVRGSIWGVVYGGLLSVCLTNAVYAFRHRRAHLLESDSMALGSQGDAPRNGTEEAGGDGSVNAI